MFHNLLDRQEVVMLERRSRASTNRLTVIGFMISFTCCQRSSAWSLRNYEFLFGQQTVNAIGNPLYLIEVILGINLWNHRVISRNI